MPVVARAVRSAPRPAAARGPSRAAWDTIRPRRSAIASVAARWAVRCSARTALARISRAMTSRPSAAGACWGSWWSTSSRAPIQPITRAVVITQADCTSPSAVVRATWARAARTSRTRRGSRGARLLRRGRGADSPIAPAGGGEEARAVVVVIAFSVSGRLDPNSGRDPAGWRSSLFEGLAILLLGPLEQLGPGRRGVLVGDAVAEDPIGPDRVGDHDGHQHEQGDQHHRRSEERRVGKEGRTWWQTAAIR